MRSLAGLLAGHTRNTSWLVPDNHIQYLPRSFSCSASAFGPRTRSDQAQNPATHDALVNALQAQGLLSTRTSTAMRAVDRVHFVQTYAGVPGTVAYQDAQLPISCGQHMPPPSVIARCLTLLESAVRPGARVLDVGSGTGYVAACLAHLAAPGGVVMCLEKQAKLVERAKHSIEQSCKELVDAGAFDIRVCNAMADPPELQGSELFHAIHLGASVEAVPAQFVKLLQPDGRLVAPLGAMHGAAPQILVAVDKARNGTVTQTEHGTISARTAPLTALHDDQVLT
eukprot:GHUV01025043.1.p1 GENE.GHUV01025043.1~~GHUV01025043.1.p1  ORF type:complete len:283 (+),score=47.65 GHUV01025043.1:239-1087(+)